MLRLWFPSCKREGAKVDELRISCGQCHDRGRSQAVCSSQTYTSLNELQGALVLADLEQFNDSLLVRLQASNLADQITDKSGVLVVLDMSEDEKDKNKKKIKTGSVKRLVEANID